MITIDEIRLGYDNIYDTVYVKCLKMLTNIQKLLIIAIALETKYNDIGRVSFYKVFNKLYFLRIILFKLGL